MFILPLRGDKIGVKGLADEQVVTSYSALKKGGALYVKQPLDPSIPYISPEAVDAINGVLVTQKDNGLFTPKGMVRRKQNLPQLGDTIEIILSTSAQGIEDHAFFEVTDLKLAHKPMSPLLVICDKSKFNLGEIKGIKRKLGFEVFNERTFKKLYLDYLPVGNLKVDDGAA